MGYAFEQWVRRQQYIIAKILGFSGLPYQWGVFYNRSTQREHPGFQIDLLYEHSKYVYTICEIKYYANLVGPNIINEMDKKIVLFDNQQKFTLKKVLITPHGITDSLFKLAYFDDVITLDDLLESE